MPVEYRWKTFEEWKSFGERKNYSQRTPTSLQKGAWKDESAWYQKGHARNWIPKFDFQRERTSIRDEWKTVEGWTKFGVERGYTKRNPLSFKESKDSEERSWYAFGIGSKWVKKFNFKRKRQDGRWQSLDEWRNYGLSEGYDAKNSKALFESNDKNERSWYRKGLKKGWLKNFDFERKRIDGRWQTVEEWNEYGFNRSYDGRICRSLELSEDRGERSWYNRGTDMGWLKEFPFSRTRVNYCGSQDKSEESLLEIYVGGNGHD